MAEPIKDDSSENSSTSAFGGPQAHFPFLYKIDFYGSLFILWLIWEIPYMLNSLHKDHVEIDVPYEMLLHGPIRYFPSATDFDMRLNCSEYFYTFLNNPAFLTDDFMGAELTKGKSEGFLRHPSVAAELGRLRNQSNISRIKFGIRLSEVCERRLPHDAAEGCKSYSYILNECLRGQCTNRVYLCWWSALSSIRFVLFAHIGSFLPGIAVIVLCMFDPPPAGFDSIARPWIAACSLCISSTFGFLYLGLFGSQVRKYLKQDAFYETFSGSDNQPPYEYSYSYGFVYTFIGSVVNFCFGICYWYVFLFSPPYPRHPSRFENRRGYFLLQIEKLKEEYGVRDQLDIPNKSTQQENNRV